MPKTNSNAREECKETRLEIESATEEKCGVSSEENHPELVIQCVNTICAH
jgi:hypothetical protein